MIPSGLEPMNKSEVEWAETRLGARGKQTRLSCSCSIQRLWWHILEGLLLRRLELTKYINQVEDVVIDSGSVPFGPATCMTGDGPAIHDLYMLSGQKWSNTDVEMECGSGVLPFTYLKSSPVSAVQWSIGLEVLLLVNDPWKTIMTTDHPNGGMFTQYPQLITWLMSKKARDDTAQGMP